MQSRVEVVYGVVAIIERALVATELDTVIRHAVRTTRHLRINKYVLGPEWCKHIYES